MEHTAVFEESVSLTPKDLRNEIKSIDFVLEERLRTRLEGRCSRHGFVVPDSVKILSRSMGMVERGRFTGSVIFQVQSEGSVLNPPDGFVLEGEVIRKNKMGLYVNYMDAIRIIVPRDVNIGNDEFESVDVGDFIKVEIKKSRFQINDEYILSVGLFKGLGKGVRRQRNVAGSTTNVPVEEEGYEEEEEDEEEEEEEEEEDEEEEEEDEALGADKTLGADEEEELEMEETE